jgi:hypothetical protein
VGVVVEAVEHLDRGIVPILESASKKRQRNACHQPADPNGVGTETKEQPEDAGRMR